MQHCYRLFVFISLKMWVLCMKPKFLQVLNIIRLWSNLSILWDSSIFMPVMDALQDFHDQQDYQGRLHLPVLSMFKFSHAFPVILTESEVVFAEVSPL